MTALPAWISAALQDKLENVSRGSLRECAQAISDTYRAGGGSEIVRTELDALAYAIVRMPATYAAIRAALVRTTEIIPDFQPRSILDVGAGPGTASWASIDVWRSVRRTTLIDSNPRLLALAGQFHDAMQRPDITADVVQGNLAKTPGDTPDADAVTASYVLAETAPSALSGMLAALWARADRLLVIVEPGTMDGFRRILKCRDHLIANGATIIAPCSHASRCPLADNERWCHFAARLPRLRDHMIAKGARVPFEDEKFSYIVAGKGFADRPTGRRILATPKVSKAGIVMTLCAPDRPEQRTIGRRDKEAYKTAKGYEWGDLADVLTP